jgi:tetratricopeptide (TPR) repeat protein
MAHGNRTAAHPEPAELEDFLLGKLDNAGRLAVLDHLVGDDCADCQRRIAGRYGKAPAEPWDYPSRPGETVWALCEPLLAESWEQLHEDPEAAVHLAAVAAMAAQSISPATRGGAALADLQARTLAELGNARRAMHDLAMAETDLLRARRRADEGTGDPLLLGRLIELTAALRISQRRFDEAGTLLEWALQVYESQDARHPVGKVLAQTAHLSLAAGRPAEAAGLLARALSLLDPSREPRALLAAVHDLLDSYAQYDRFREAWSLLWKTRGLYAAHGGRCHQLKLSWIEGRVAAGLGYAGRAEGCLRSAREGFLEMKLPYAAAQVALDLGILWLEKGRAAEARELIAETLETFNLLRLRREAVPAMILLSGAAQDRQLSLLYLRSLRSELRKIEI